jgi:hypothetical protein
MWFTVYSLCLDRKTVEILYWYSLLPMWDPVYSEQTQSEGNLGDAIVILVTLSNTQTDQARNVNELW